MEATKDVAIANEFNAAADVETSVEQQCVRELTALELNLVGGGSGLASFY